MANATTRDARAGFAIYLQSFEGTTLEEINARLAASGYGAIAQRTFTHYRKLVNAGFNRYISINRFDVARASRAYENMSSLGRYRYRPTRQEINIIFAKGSRFFEARGYVVEVGDVGAMIEFADEPQIVGIQRFKPSRGDRVILSYAGSIEASTGVVVDSDLESAPVLVEIEHARLISVAEIEDVPSLPTTSFRFKLIAASDNTITIDVLGRRLQHFFDLLEGLRALLNEAGRQSDAYEYAAPPVVMEIRLASPAVLLLQLPPELVSIISWSLLGGILATTMRKKWHEGTLIKKQGGLANAEIERRELDVVSDRQEYEFRGDLINNVRERLPRTTISDDQIVKILDAHVLPSSRELARTDIREIDVSVDQLSDEDDK